MSNRRLRKTPSGSSANPALAPNRERLKVGDAVAGPPAQPPRAPAKPKRVPFGSYIDPELHKELRVMCAVEGIEIRDALDQALRQWITNRNAL
ncbi:hypothetical protein AB0G85_35685 [Streptomyces sioyaensis]|uniref:hypothetical protein n=1 Tax=Streptomyces sioyaensis TaxID=67364 RepID=UPI0033F033FC